MYRHSVASVLGQRKESDSDGQRQGYVLSVACVEACHVRGKTRTVPN